MLGSFLFAVGIFLSIHWKLDIHIVIVMMLFYFAGGLHSKYKEW